MPWASIASTGISLGSSLLGSRSKKKAEKKARRAAEYAAAKAEAAQKPYQLAGREALYDLADLLGLSLERPIYNKRGLISGYTTVTKSERFGALTRTPTLEDFYASPDYLFRLGEGEKAINRAAAARGGFFSGRAGKELSRYGQGLAAGEYGDWYGRQAGEKERLYRMLSGLTGGGQQAAGNVGDIARGLGSTLGSIYAAGGERAAGTYADIAKALQGGLGNLLFASQIKNTPTGQAYSRSAY